MTTTRMSTPTAPRKIKRRISKERASLCLFGALIYFGYHYRGYIGAMIRSQIVPVVVYNLLMGLFIPGIDMWGHVGGLLGGILTANMLGTIEDKKYNISSILLFVIYFAFLIYLGIYR